MNRRGRWLAPALWILGLAAVALAVTRGGRWALLAAAGGAAFACGLTLPALVRRHARRPGARAVDFAHTIDLLRRAHDAHACWAVGLRDGDVESLGEREVHEDRRRRGAALAQLASVDGRVHVAREPHGTYVAVGDFPYGAGALLALPDAGAEFTDPVAEELRRLVATMRLAELEIPGARGGGGGGVPVARRARRGRGARADRPGPRPGHGGRRAAGRAAIGARAPTRGGSGRARGRAARPARPADGAPQSAGVRARAGTIRR